jgi:hypothetical protein
VLWREISRSVTNGGNGRACALSHGPEINRSSRLGAPPFSGPCAAVGSDQPKTTWLNASSRKPSSTSPPSARDGTVSWWMGSQPGEYSGKGEQEQQRSVPSAFKASLREQRGPSKVTQQINTI